jgi:phage terminase large subunit
MIEVHLPKAFKRLTEEARIKLLVGGRGSAKSETVGRYLLLKGKEQEENILCCREFQASIKESVHSLLSALISEMGLSDFYRVLETEIRGKNGTKFVYAGVRNNIANIKSMFNIKRCWGEEAQTFSENSLNVLIPTIRAEGSEIIFTMNPMLPTDPVYDRYILNASADCIVMKANYEQNPYFPDVLEKDRLRDLERLGAASATYRNIWLGEPREAVEGAIFAEALQRARDGGRIGEFPYDDRYPVSAFSDIGWNDFTSWWFLQFVNHQPRLIATYQNQFQKTPHYVDVLQKLNFRYDRIVLPHDAENEHANTERTWLQIFQNSFQNANVYAGKRQAVELRLEAAKNMFDLFQFDKTGTVDGRSALAHYHFATDPLTKRLTRDPFHGPESNYADAFGYMCLEMIEPRKKVERRVHGIYSGVGR